MTITLVLTAICLISSIALIFTGIRTYKQDREIERLKAQLRNPEKSEELTEFLADVKTNGFAFVRVNPTNILYRR